MKRRELLSTIAAAGIVVGVSGPWAGLAVDNLVEAASASPAKHRIEKGFAAILDVATSAGEPRGTGISFPVPFSNYGPKSVTYLIISEYNISDISITPPTPYGARFTIVARDPGEFECSIVWTAEE